VWLNTATAGQSLRGCGKAQNKLKEGIMTLGEIAELIEELSGKREVLKALVDDVLGIGDGVWELLGPKIEEFGLAYRPEFLGKKLKALMKNGFTRKEAIYLIANDTKMLQEMFTKANKK
jgi:hypothetical protein